MRATGLLHDVEFRDANPFSQPLFVDDHGRVLRFTLKPGQRIPMHEAKHSPFYVVVLKGKGAFTGADGKERQFGPNSLLIFEAGERHSVRALDEELVFVGFLHGVENARAGRVGGEIGRSEARA